MSVSGWIKRLEYEYEQTASFMNFLREEPDN